MHVSCIPAAEGRLGLEVSARISPTPAHLPDARVCIRYASAKWKAILAAKRAYREAHGAESAIWREQGPVAPATTYSTSVIRIGWAPSQRQRRPTSRRRSAQPSSGSTAANTFAASWPTFDAVVHPPYGKKISHSLMPPG